LDGAVVAILAAVITVHDIDIAGYRWAVEAAQGISDTSLRSGALKGIERGVKRWKGEDVPGDYVGNTIWQIIQNVASAQGIDISDEASPWCGNSALLLAMILSSGFSRTVKTFWSAWVPLDRSLDTHSPGGFSSNAFRIAFRGRNC
jgi:hypothetical protein